MSSQHRMLWISQPQLCHCFLFFFSRYVSYFQFPYSLWSNRSGLHQASRPIDRRRFRQSEAAVHYSHRGEHSTFSGFSALHGHTRTSFWSGLHHWCHWRLERQRYIFNFTKQHWTFFPLFSRVPTFDDPLLSRVSDFYGLISKISCWFLNFFFIRICRSIGRSRADLPSGRISPSGLSHHPHLLGGPHERSRLFLLHFPVIFTSFDPNLFFHWLDFFKRHFSL